MERFFLWKKNFLEKKDKSNRQKIDPGIRKIIELINKNPNYFTTSSCSGRVYLFKEEKRKCDIDFLFLKHGKIKFEEIKKIKFPKKGLIWLKLEPFILHLCCRDLTSAEKLLKIGYHIFKRTALLSLGKKIVLEIKGSSSIEMPLALNGRFLVNDNFLKLLIKNINKKMERIKQQRERFYRLLENAFKTSTTFKNNKIFDF